LAAANESPAEAKKFAGKVEAGLDGRVLFARFEFRDICIE
jgi:hypothetical protein